MESKGRRWVAAMHHATRTMGARPALAKHVDTMESTVILCSGLSMDLTLQARSAGRDNQGSQGLLCVRLVRSTKPRTIA
jgi:hypothetical protein